MAACTLTVYRLNAAGEVYEVVGEEGDEELEPVGARAVAMSPDSAEASFDVSAWWSKQLGSALKGVLTPH